MTVTPDLNSRIGPSFPRSAKAKRKLRVRGSHPTFLAYEAWLSTGLPAISDLSVPSCQAVTCLLTMFSDRLATVRDMVAIDNGLADDFNDPTVVPAAPFIFQP